MAGTSPVNILPHSVLLRIETNSVPWHEWKQAPVAVSSLDPMAQGHPVLPPYGSGLGRERAVFPRYYRSRPSLPCRNLQLPVNCKKARSGCARFGHSCSWVVIT
jgi:hypothetical protein